MKVIKIWEERELWSERVMNPNLKEI